MKNSFRILLYLSLGVMVLSCTKYRKIQKSTDWRLKYDEAINYYNKEEYYKASHLLESILPIIRGTKEAELATFYYAYANYFQKQFIVSAHHFGEFIRTFGNSEYVMEAAMMRSMSLYMQSPEYNLDQTVTYEAITSLQNFIERYPMSEYTHMTDSLINQLQVKLETKAYHKSKLYFKTRRYKAALVAFKNFKKDFPDSKYNEEILYLVVESTYEYAKVSSLNKEQDRYQEVVTKYNQFIDLYPQSKYLAKAEGIFIKTQKELTKFAENNL